MRLKYLLIFTLISFIAGANSYSQEFRHTRELIMFVRNGEPGGTITFFTESDGSTVWDQDGLVTTDPLFISPCDLVIPLRPDGSSNNPNYGWDTNEPMQEEPHFGRGKYEISVGVGSATLIVNCYGTNQLFGNDREITYDVNMDSFYNENNEIITSIYLYDNPSGLQPIPPDKFICTNSNETGVNPHFEWWWPNELRPSGWPFNFKYKIYRSENLGPFVCIATLTFSKTPIEWDDPGVSIYPYGSRYIYYSTAYIDPLLESEISDKAYIRGNPYKVLPDNPEDNLFEPDVKQISTSPYLYAYPNPFNPTTIITYQLPKDGYVCITVYNITGQTIAELVNKKQFAGKYNVSFDGRTIAGGIYLVLFQLDNQHVMRKILLFK